MTRNVATVLLAGVLTLLVAVAGCSEIRSGAGDSGASDADVPDPVGAEDVSDATESSTQVGFDLFQGLAGERPDENVVTSPYSAAILLTMLMNGADGETRQAIGDVLHLDDPSDHSINEQHQTLADYLANADPDVDLAIANSLWANDGTPFEDEYMSEMEDTFEARIEEIDLGSEGAIDTIDEWVGDQTNDRIDEMAEDLGVPDPNLVLILLNAVYFQGNWTEPFDPDQTREVDFTTAAGEQTVVPMMVKDDAHLHTQKDGFQLLRLPYGDQERFAMDILLPDEDTDLIEFRHGIDSELISDATSSLGESRVNVVMPSFELEYSSKKDLDGVLQDLGMGIAYGGDADFTPMSPNAPFLDTVIQKTYIRVDEEGTEAAAVTGGAMDESQPPQFVVDRPFIFTISEVETETILFLGQVADPSE